MIDFLTILKNNKEISDFKVEISKNTSKECYLIKGMIETIRENNLNSYFITIYKDIDNFRGESRFEIKEDITEQEFSELIAKNIYRASLIKNEYYPLPSDNLVSKLSSNIDNMTLNEALNKVLNIINKVKYEEYESFNALEIFIHKNKLHIINSKGLDKGEIKSYGFIEAIPTYTKDNLSVELYESFSFENINEKEILEELSDSLLNVKYRFNAKNDLNIKKCNVILRVPEIKEMLQNIIQELNLAKLYTQSSYYKIGDKVASNPLYDKLNIKLLKMVNGSSSNHSFDSDGGRLLDISLVENNEIKNFYGSSRFAYYTKKEATGNLLNISLETSKNDFNLYKKDAYIDLVSLSGLQIDLYNDYIGGEVRLGYLNKDGKKIPYTSFSVSAKLSDALNNLILSNEEVIKEGYKGPKEILLKDFEIL
jgi:predicted Zn-dependent protease